MQLGIYTKPVTLLLGTECVKHEKTECPVLGIHGGQVGGARVGGDAQRLPGQAFADATCITPSRQHEPRRIQGKMGTRIHFFVLTLNSA